MQGGELMGSKEVDLTVAGQSPTYTTLMELTSDVARAVYRKRIPDIEFITEYRGVRLIRKVGR